MNTEPRWEAGD